MAKLEKLTTQGRWFVDSEGRRVLLRGINLGGNCKIPFGWNQRDAANPAHAAPVSFVGRPFPLSEADEHFRRLKGWGFNCLRLLTTWEAVEHRGPGVYDEEYLDYFYEIARRAGEHGFYVFVDPHQDVWSRLSGGDGAPTWTLEAAGFDPSRLNRSDAAITQWGRSVEEYPAMVWPNNWNRLASCTMFTLFFAGDRFAPNLKVGGEGIQSYLQRHFIQSMSQIAQRMKDLPHVLGYDSMNEPSRGYLGLKRLSEPMRVYNTCSQVSAFESMFIPAGFSKEVPWIERQGVEQRETRRVVLNPGRISAWKSPEADVWKNHGVWDVGPDGQPRLLRDDYFAEAEFFQECLLPFARSFAGAIHSAHPGAMMFLEGEPGSKEPVQWDLPMSVVNAAHWYDVLTLITKHFDPEKAVSWTDYSPILGRESVAKSFEREIGAYVEHSKKHLGGPTVIGEFGLNYDLDGAAAYRTGDFSSQELALSMYYDAMDANLVHSCQWNYTSDNTNAEGDHWNGEDLSVYSLDQPEGRAVRGFSRPTIRACAGNPILQRFDREDGSYRFEMEAAGEGARSSAPTEIFVPVAHYPQGVRWEVSSGKVEFKPDEQLLLWSGAEAGIQRLKLMGVTK